MHTFSCSSRCGLAATGTAISVTSPRCGIGCSGEISIAASPCCLFRSPRCIGCSGEIAIAYIEGSSIFRACQCESTASELSLPGPGPGRAAGRPGPALMT